jgi:hypothetical protein
MSKVAISGNASGTGVFTIASPNSNTDRTLSLPDNSGTVVVTGTTPALNGITFPASQVTSADANCLDDYEEGTWTPVITFGGNQTGQTYAIQLGRYTKVGNLVTAVGYAQLANAGSATGSLALGGLPFVSANITDYIVTCPAALDNTASAIDQPFGSLNPNSTSVGIIAGTGANNATGLTESVRGSSFRVRVSVSYQAA